MTQDDDSPYETGERRVARGPELELVPGGKADEPADFIIDKTKKPSVFQLREVSVPPQVAAERAEQIIEAAAARGLPRDTERDLTSPASEPPDLLDAGPAQRDEAEVPAATVPAARTRSRTVWSAVAIGIALSVIAVVVIASGSAGRRVSEPAASAHASAQAATAAPPVSSGPPPPASATATEAPAPPAAAVPSPLKPPAPPKSPAARASSVTPPSVAAPPSAFTTKPPF
jgi:hypothetical protein